MTAGYGAYRINANVIEPTKSRVLLGGIPIQLISLNHKPAYKTPLLINCCTYTNPFKTKTKNKQGELVEIQEALSPLQGDSKVDNNSHPPYYYPYWLDLIYLPQTKIFEAHSS